MNELLTTTTDLHLTCFRYRALLRSLHNTHQGLPEWQLHGGPSVARGSTYGTVNGPRVPSMAAIHGPWGSPMVRKIAADGWGTDFGGPSVARLITSFSCTYL